MKKIKWELNIDLKSKVIDLIIVIIGITVAFQLDNWNESVKSDSRLKEYMKSFYAENKVNHENLISSLKLAKSNKEDIDSLKEILLSQNYSDSRIKYLTASMTELTDFSPSKTTMQNIIASGEFGLVEDIELRKYLISTYDEYEITTKLESLLSDYVNQYVTPFFFENIRLSNFSYIHKDNTQSLFFENIVIGYDVLLNQVIAEYVKNIKMTTSLNEKLSLANEEFGVSGQ